ncbi:MAG: alanine--tRNA ligase-related protein, partial [Patescibacteria group bacterium]|nr:alanine--tRNA ligase-related protein [Patescibacteria group bacterium]
REKIWRTWIGPDRITISIFKGEDGIPEDKESFDIWHKEIGIPAHKINRTGRSETFWGPTGSEGPCGPTTEIYVDGIEVWNIVFNQYYQKSDKTLEKLEIKGIDTGMGFERLVIMMQGVSNVYETDLFIPIIKQIQEVSHSLDERVLRILADHMRSSIFLIADGVRPSNKEAGYVLRRLLRRVLAYSSKYDIHADLFPLILEKINEIFGEIYPEVKNKKEILDVYYEEKSKFEKALSEGLRAFTDLMSEAKEESFFVRLQKTLRFKHVQKTLSGKEAFSLYETYGFPKELMQEFCREKNVVFDEGGFDEEYKKHQEISRAGAEKKFGGHGLVLDTGELKAGSKEDMEKVIRLHTATHLLQKALRNTLGEDVKQMGSDINPERGRFDFSFGRKLTEEEIKKVENEVNDIINKDLPVYFKEMPIEEAKKTGALFFFKEKYPNVVRVYFIGPDTALGGKSYSIEFCGGPHVEHTLQIGSFKIQKQESVGAGTRRIKFLVK